MIERFERITCFTMPLAEQENMKASAYTASALTSPGCERMVGKREIAGLVAAFAS